MTLITVAQWKFWRYVAAGALRGRPVVFLTSAGPELYTIADASRWQPTT